MQYVPLYLALLYRSLGLEKKSLLYFLHYSVDFFPPQPSQDELSVAPEPPPGLSRAPGLLLHHHRRRQPHCGADRRLLLAGRRQQQLRRRRQWGARRDEGPGRRRGLTRPGKKRTDDEVFLGKIECSFYAVVIAVVGRGILLLIQGEKSRR